MAFDILLWSIVTSVKVNVLGICLRTFQVGCRASCFRKRKHSLLKQSSITTTSLTRCPHTRRSTTTWKPRSIRSNSRVRLNCRAWFGRWAQRNTQTVRSTKLVLVIPKTVMVYCVCYSLLVWIEFINHVRNQFMNLGFATGKCSYYQWIY